jgi:NADPH:quinone reductase-like Zn-dependent oxidoreductase
MRQVFVTKAGAPEVLQVKESPDPEVKDDEVRVRVKAAGVNFADLAMRMGMYPAAPPIPFVIGYEVAGVIDRVGKSVADLNEGDRVVAMPRFGGYTDTLVISGKQALPLPANVSFEQGAALPVAYLTAHHALHYTGTLHRGSRVFIHSVAGGVGLAALQMARARECLVLGTCSPSKFEFVKERGCAHPIDSGSDVVAEVKKILGDQLLDLVLDPIGGPWAKKGYALLAPAGRLVEFGFSATQGDSKRRNIFKILGAVLGMPWWAPFKLMNDNKTVTGINMERMFDHLEIVRPQMESLVGMLSRGELNPHVDRTFTFEEAPAAHHYLHDRKARGKILLVP